MFPPMRNQELEITPRVSVFTRLDSEVDTKTDTNQQ